MTSHAQNQVGGDHYKAMKIDVITFCQANNIGFVAGNVIKYVLRNKGNRLEDLKKARHYLSVLIEEAEK